MTYVKGPLGNGRWPVVVRGVRIGSPPSPRQEDRTGAVRSWSAVAEGGYVKDMTAMTAEDACPAAPRLPPAPGEKEDASGPVTKKQPASPRSFSVPARRPGDSQSKSRAMDRSDVPAYLITQSVDLQSTALPPIHEG